MIVDLENVNEEDVAGKESEVLNPLQSGPECTLGDIGLLIFKEM